MVFIWRRDAKSKYCIGFCNIHSNKVCFSNISTFAPLILTISSKQLEKFLKDNGAKKDLNGKFYFKNKDDVVGVVDRLNIIKKLSK